MPYRDRGDKLKNTREWKTNNPEANREHKRRYKERHREQIAEYQRRYYETHKEKVSKQRKVSQGKLYWEARKNIILALGGKCKTCGFTDFRALDVHHRYGGGVEERKLYVQCPSARYGIGNYLYFRQMLTHTNDYELLCANCHRITTWNNNHPNGL